MTITQAFTLGVVQGVTEFLPISSSGHLILVPALLGWEVQSLSFDIALHVGTLLAVGLYFRNRLWAMGRDRRLWGLVLVGTLPAAVGGFLADDFVESYLRSKELVALNLVGIALVMYLAEVFSKQNREFTSLGLRDAGVIGVFQMLALVPGVSRSGITLVGGLLRGLRAGEAAEFSFILSVPVIAGAGVLHLRRLLSQEVMVKGDLLLLLVGMATSALVGALVIRLFIDFLRGHSLRIFVIYRIILGLLVLFLLD